MAQSLRKNSIRVGSSRHSFFSEPHLLDRTQPELSITKRSSPPSQFDLDSRETSTGAGRFLKYMVAGIGYANLSVVRGGA